MTRKFGPSAEEKEQFLSCLKPEARETTCLPRVLRLAVVPGSSEVKSCAVWSPLALAYVRTPADTKI
jgi:hypothetical protein